MDELMELELDDDELEAVEGLAESLGVEVEMLGHLIIPQYSKIVRATPG